VPSTTAGRGTLPPCAERGTLEVAQRGEEPLTVSLAKQSRLHPEMSGFAVSTAVSTDRGVLHASKGREAWPAHRRTAWGRQESLCSYREQTGHCILGADGDMLPDWVISVVVAFLDLLKEHGVIVIVCKQGRASCGGLHASTMALGLQD